MKKKDAYAASVSLPDTLKLILEKPTVYEQMRNYRDSLLNDTETLSNVVQGELWTNKYLDPTKDKYPILIFSDGFEVGNSLGSNAGEQSLIGIYASLPCLSPHLVANLQNIFLSTLCYTKHMKEFGNEAVFAATIKDLNFLSESGLELNIDGSSVKVFFRTYLTSGRQ